MDEDNISNKLLDWIHHISNERNNSDSTPKGGNE
jgi:hypothetical protein